MISLQPKVTACRGYLRAEMMAEPNASHVQNSTVPRRQAVAPSAPAPGQAEFFPIKLTRLDPQPDRTADTLGEGEGEDGCRYVVKSDKNGKCIRASEWISTNIASLVGFHTAPAVRLEHLDGTLVFGSRRLAGIAKQVESFALLNPALNQGQVPQTVAPPAVPLKKTLSELYAFDLALHNDDRHFTNYMFVEESGHNRLLAFDFSRSLFWEWPWTSFLAPTTKTRMVGAILRQLHGFDLPAAERVIAKLETLSVPAVERIVNDMPVGWLGDQLKKEFLDWWSGSGRSTRLAALRKGLNDGSLL